MRFRKPSDGATACTAVSIAQKFYLVIAAMVVGGCALNFVNSLSPVKALFYSAVLNGVVTVPLLIVLMLVCNKRQIVKNRVNGRVSTLLGWLTVVFMGLAVAFMLWATATGHVS